jgi:hypothetical protein
MEADNAFDGLTTRCHGYVVGFELFGGCCMVIAGDGYRLFDKAIGADHEKIAEYHRRVGDMQIGAFTDRFLHAVGQVPKCTGHAFARHCQYWPESGFVNDHIDILGLEPAKHCRLSAFGERGIVGEVPFTLQFLEAEGWPGRNFLRSKSAFDYQPAGDVPMERLYVLLALGRALIRCKMGKSIALIDPLAGFGECGIFWCLCLCCILVR